jgi:nitrite reductase/ring-hydroxylating ferredoxin subunit
MENKELKMSEINRREFVIAAAAVCAASACMMCGVANGADAAPDAGGKVDVGTAADYAKDGVYDKLAQTKKVIVVREKDKMYALTAKCPHQGDVLDCQKHHTKFENTGAAKPGGKTKVALFRLGISTDPAGHIWVDPSKTFGEKQWEEAGASIKVS